MSSILIEGGSRLATSFLHQGLIDKIYAIISPVVIGNGIPTLGALGVSRLSDAVHFTAYGFKPLGSDILFWGYPEI
jgi:diaminohydroxyphosphoribosylaminopyrimidine deaminase/5-amino-6-(5-phosphoribosylamino)uracil reductase